MYSEAPPMRISLGNMSPSAPPACVDVAMAGGLELETAVKACVAAAEALRFSGRGGGISVSLRWVEGVAVTPDSVGGLTVAAGWVEGVAIASALPVGCADLYVASPCLRAALISFRVSLMFLPFFLLGIAGQLA